MPDPPLDPRVSPHAHRALQIQDITDLIVEQLLDDRKALYQLLHVSKLFYGPSVASLWTNLPNFRPVLALSHEMPLLQKNKPALDSKLIHLRRRCDLIHKLEIAEELDGLKRLFGKNLPSLLRNLRSLSVKPGSNEGLSAVNIMVPESLQELCLYQGTVLTAQALGDFFSGLPTLAPNLSSLIIRDIRGKAYVDASMVVKRLLRLKDVTLECVPENDTIRGFCNSAIQSLTIEFHAFGRSSSVLWPLTWHGITFPGLRSLCLSGKLDRCAQALNQFTLPVIEEVRLRVCNFPTSEEARQASRGVARYSGTLQVFRMWAEYTTQEHHSMQPATELEISPSDLSQLCGCPLLREVHIGFCKAHKSPYLIWKDADILNMTGNWAGLQRLELRSVPVMAQFGKQQFRPASGIPDKIVDYGRRRMLSVNGLLPLAEHCESLRHLAVNLDFRRFEPPDAICKPVPSFLRLELLDGCIVRPDARVEADGYREPAEGWQPDRHLVAITNFFISLWPNVRLAFDKAPHVNCQLRQCHCKSLKYLCEWFNAGRGRALRMQRV